MILILLLFTILHNTLVLCQDEQGGILCTSRTCTEYIDKIGGCPTISECSVQSSNHSGVILPAGPNDPCNCCPHCLINIKEGEICDPGSKGGTVPDHICGPGLICNEKDKICKKMKDEAPEKTPYCAKAQNDYDLKRAKGTLGHLQVRPECDSEGFFKPYKCIPGQTCFCLDKEGKRIFGEVPFTNMASLLLKCECPRKYYQVEKIIGRSLHPQEHFRCTENGDYDTIQCIGDKCMCVDTQDGAPSDPDAAPVIIANISAKSLPDCFDNKTHLEHKFYHECAVKHIEMFKEIEEARKNNFTEIFNYVFPDCGLDGKYAPVQKNGKNARCVDPYGKLIENYVIVINATDTFKIDCKCARTNLHIRKNNLERPHCCKNGNFHPIQCRRGLCRCVDSDGYQTEKEVDISKISQLPCHNNISKYCDNSSTIYSV